MSCKIRNVNGCNLVTKKIFYRQPLHFFNHQLMGHPSSPFYNCSRGHQIITNGKETDLWNSVIERKDDQLPFQPLYLLDV